MGERFDIITMFSTVEHFRQDQQKKILSDIRNLLNKDGIFIVSTNNKDFTSQRNPFHENELNAEEFRNLIGLYFKAEFFGIKQTFHPRFNREGFKNKCVNLVFKTKFIQEIIQPLIPQRIKDNINSRILRLPPSKEEDFCFTDNMLLSENFLAVCKK